MPFKPGQSGNVATQFKPGKSGNPKGLPKGTKHISKWIDEILHDPQFNGWVFNGKVYEQFEGIPMEAMIKAQMVKALAGDTKAFEALAKFGYGVKVSHDGLNPVLVLLQKFELGEGQVDARKDTEA